MRCTNCKKKFEPDLISNDTYIEIAAHDNNKLDIIITCPKCDHRLNIFIDISEMIDLDK